MNIYVYSDESGVFDKEHNDVFVFAGLIILGSESKEMWSRKYSAVEKITRKNEGLSSDCELKASKITNKAKGKLFRSLNDCEKFCGIINQERVLDQIFTSKKDKQRYLDYAHKITVKRAFERLIKNGKITPESVERLYFYIDEHTTATNGRYELKEGLEQEFKFGTYNWRYDKYFPPIFPNTKEVNLEFCNSKSKLLIRASDIVANKVFYHACKKDYEKLCNISNLNVLKLP